MRRTPVIDVPELERELLRKGLTVRAAGRPRCRDCHRTPLVGERIYVYESGRVACELCRTMRREQPVSSEPVRGVEHGHTVRLTARAAA